MNFMKPDFDRECFTNFPLKALDIEILELRNIKLPSLEVSFTSLGQFWKKLRQIEHGLQPDSPKFYRISKNVDVPHEKRNSVKNDFLVDCRFCTSICPEECYYSQSQAILRPVNNRKRNELFS